MEWLQPIRLEMLEAVGKGPGIVVKIVVVSDTHTDSIDNLPQRVLDDLSGADMIIHAGDFTGKRLVDALRKIGPFRGVYGNIDGPEVRKELPAIDTIQAEDIMIGVNHPAEGGSPLSLEQRLRPKFPRVQAIIHGHSHQTKSDFRDRVLWFNPGSATGTFPARQKTYGILTIDKDIRGEIIRL